MPRLSFQIGEQSTGLVLPKPQNPDGSLENGEILFFLLGSGSRNPSLYVGQSILINTSSDDERMNIASSLVYTI